MQHVDETTDRLNLESEQTRREETQREAVNEAVFMSQFLPRSLNQVAEHEIQKLEQGEVEDTYAHAVAALTGNRDIVEAVAKKTGRDNVMIRPVQSILSEGGGQSDGDVKSLNANVKAVTFQDGPDDADPDEDDGSDAESMDVSDDEEPDADFVKTTRTLEQLQAEKEAKRAERKANKKAVKEARSEKRLTKIKKKDKKRAIKKAKAGNKKN
jgi:RIO kinase 1